MDVKPYLYFLLFAVVFFPAEAKAEDEITFYQINELLGIELLADDLLWDDTPKSVAKRLRWRPESKTSNQSSFRHYSQADYEILGSQAYSSVLYGRDGKPSQVSIVFINRGDVEALLKRIDDDDKEDANFYDLLEDAVEEEGEAMTAKLTDFFGDPSKARFGKGGDLKEKVTRWDWNGHAFLLSIQEEQYLGLRIVSSEFADSRGTLEEVSDREMKEYLLSKVVRRENGDVLISDMPMVNQGPKGYCVPATCERFLRYFGIPADMYMLARVGNTGFGGGTTMGAITNQLESIARSNSRRFEYEDVDMEAKDIAKYIDQGIPLMWRVYAENQIYMEEINKRTKERRDVADWTQWKEKLDKVRTRLEDARRGRYQSGHHMCMIIGYNKETGEIASPLQ
ncbi:MAG: hypothetical protein AAFY98_10510, partial [Verrucomicrobiota bacterium]